jgi:hypothetical protein
VSYATEIVGAFSLNHRPLEYLVYPFAGHQLTTPKQKEASQQTTLEWMSFWLKGEPPPDKERADRWLDLRREQEAVIRDARKKGIQMADLPPLETVRSTTQGAAISEH